MSLEKIGRQLRREFKTNPKKAVTLGVLFLVAAYFWAPLIWKTKGPDVPVKPGAVTAQAQPTAGGPAETTNKTAPQHRWQDLDREMNRDPRMSRNLEDSVERLGRNPFAGQTVAVAVVEPKPEPMPEEEPRTPTIVTPADAGLSLSGTMIGKRRTALISGKVYEEGREVESKDGLVFLVKDIQSRRIILERDGQQFELVMARGRNSEPATSAASETSSTSKTATKEDDQ